MKIKKFKAKTFSEALILIKKELGPDAVILSTEQSKGTSSLVEVVAAIDHDSGVYKKETGTSETRVDIATINSELRTLKDILRQFTVFGYEVKMSPEKMKLLGFLRKNAISDDFAVRLCEKASSIDDLRELIKQEISSLTLRKKCKAALIIGSTGVGKTTTIIKLATHAIREKKRVALISLDTNRIGAVEQMAVYAKVLGVPLEIVNTPNAIKSALFRHLERDKIFIDTTGRNPRDKGYLRNLSVIYKLGIPVETHLLMSANSDGAFLTNSRDYYGEMHIDCLGFTKIDEAERLGCIYNITKLFQRPVVYITNGQRIPQDIDFVQPEKLVDMILKRKSGVCVPDKEK